jgi:hypothetical protein
LEVLNNSAIRRYPDIVKPSEFNTFINTVSYPMTIKPEEAIYRVFNGPIAYTGLRCDPLLCHPDLIKDFEAIAIAYRDLLDKQAAEAAERAKPIDAEWLKGFEHEYVIPRETPVSSWRYTAVKLTVYWDDGCEVEIESEAGNATYHNLTSRGELLDLLRGFKITQ